MRGLRVLGMLVLVVLLSAWGTLADKITLPKDTLADLRRAIEWWGTNPETQLAELDDRSGPHPLHQFIAYQAWLMLSKDPAYADGQSGFPTGEQINTWDGIERENNFMRPADDVAHLPGGIGSSLPGFGGQSADAEHMGWDLAGNSKGFNKLYNGRAHYYNPWLDDGDAPKIAGENYARLVHAIVEGEAPNNTAHYAAYLSHYLSDVTSAKHADAFMLDGATVLALSKIADEFVKDESLLRALASTGVSDAERLLRKRVSDINHGMSEAYWQRIDKHIALQGGSTYFKRGPGPRADIPESSMRTSVACYLDALGHRPPGQTLAQFFTYFDPLYFNGPIIDPATGPPKWQMCTGFSEHLRWETNTAQFKTVIEYMSGSPKEMLWKERLKGAYRPFTPAKEFFSADPAVAPKAQQAAVAALTKECSKEVHGDIGSEADFTSDYSAYLDMAIRCVYTAYRASITALRVEALGRKAGEGTVRLWINVKNLADKPASLHDVQISLGGKTRPGWTVSFAGDSVAAGDTVQLRMKLTDVPDGAKVEDLTVDVHGELAGIPDAGWRRAKVQERSLEVSGKYSPEPIGDKKGPIDVIVVFDTTGSMGSSITAMRNNAIATIKRLKEHSEDVRLAITTFRDLKEKSDLPHFKVKAFTSDLESAFAFLNDLTADGGGDQAEDQLEGISRGLELWEKEGNTPDRIPNKIIIVITDAPAHAPDSKGNTYKSIAERAFKVDPAHIYPIVIGSDAGALATAKELAESTGGKVLQTAKGEDAAAAVLEAISTAESTYGGEAAPAKATSTLTAVGIVGALAGAILLVIGIVLARRRPEAAGG